MKQSSTCIPVKVSQRRAGRTSGGFTIVELLVALVLGLLIVGGTIGVYLSNQQSFRLQEDLGKIQENGRFAFELLSREIRDAGSNPCAVKAVTSVIRDASLTTPWWADWNSGTLIGYDDAQVAPAVAFGVTTTLRLAATDAITVLRTDLNDETLRTIQSHNVTTTAVVVSSVTSYQSAEPVLICDLTSGAIFDVWAVSNSLNELDHQNTAPSSNCTSRLGFPLLNDCSNPTTKTFAVGGFVSKLNSGFWYIGTSDRGTPSLYRQTITRRVVAGAPAIVTEGREMVPNVSNMQIEYLTRRWDQAANDLAATWVPATDAKFDAASNGWRAHNVPGVGVSVPGIGNFNPDEVVGVRITLTLTSPSGITVEGVPLTRTVSGVIKVRNRETKS